MKVSLERKVLIGALGLGALAFVLDRMVFSAGADADEPARTYARIDVPTLPPDATMGEAIALLEARGDFRLVVLDGESEGATLAGLLCLDRRGATFCTFTPATEAQAP